MKSQTLALVGLGALALFFLTGETQASPATAPPSGTSGTLPRAGETWDWRFRLSRPLDRIEAEALERTTRSMLLGTARLESFATEGYEVRAVVHYERDAENFILPAPGTRFAMTPDLTVEVVSATRRS